jgi:hypothetical protein
MPFTRAWPAWCARHRPSRANRSRCWPIARRQGARRAGWRRPCRDGQPVILVGMQVDVREHCRTASRRTSPSFRSTSTWRRTSSRRHDADRRRQHRVARRKIVAGHVHCRIVHGGEIKSRKGVNVPYTLLPIPALTDKDRADASLCRGPGRGLDRAQLCRHRRRRERTARDRGRRGGAQHMSTVRRASWPRSSGRTAWRTCARSSRPATG